MLELHRKGFIINENILGIERMYSIYFSFHLIIEPILVLELAKLMSVFTGIYGKVVLSPSQLQCHQITILQPIYLTSFNWKVNPPKLNHNRCNNRLLLRPLAYAVGSDIGPFVTISLCFCLPVKLM